MKEGKKGRRKGRRKERQMNELYLADLKAKKKKKGGGIRKETLLASLTG